MKKFLFMCSLILLAGCAGPGDRLPDVQNANVDLHGTQPCIASVFAPGDRISSIQIGSTSGDNESFHKYFTDDLLIPVSGKCLPLFDYRFSPGKQYVVYYSIDNPNNKRERIIQASFSISNELKNRS
ncbi:hypothetical protein EV102420_07_00895 [Pseudescherichia vulneris NBRC 102420]|uniref:DUF7480 domain-containing protein n=1 Tax=Pseudescherichia vulneris NBRC 102420 TaxID=1115515 RepID=A0A090UXL6_PSEVU|nr:putative T6SS immunity periplasmic lipoprotein [Pseudescherichia vulneris]GAL57271.1 hypothetical protein EV102420_07_00895 [Pseudescherichia vulneris NBRC 102420]